MLNRYRRWRREREARRRNEYLTAEAERSGLYDAQGRIVWDVSTPYRTEEQRRRGEELKKEIHKRLNALAEEDERRGHG